MANFTTITEHEILSHALYWLLEMKEREEERDRKMIANCGRHGAISQARIKRFNAQIDELHDAILALEAKGEF